MNKTKSYAVGHLSQTTLLKPQPLPGNPNTKFPTTPASAPWKRRDSFMSRNGLSYWVIGLWLLDFLRVAGGGRYMVTPVSLAGGCALNPIRLFWPLPHPFSMAEFSRDTSPSHPQHGKVEQMPLNYSESQAAGSSTNDSHHRYRKREHRGIHGPTGNLKDPVTDLSSNTENESSYSYHSARDLSSFLREVHGRMFNTQSDLYVLPSDDGEFHRLDKQHYAFVLGQGGLYPSECRDVVQKLLSSHDGNERRAILDLGCGSGIWAIEMAREFPNCDVVGLDLAPAPIDLETLPLNCRFEIDDVNLGLSHYHGQFDLIHVRCVGSGITDHTRIMRDVEACLKPGGIVFFIDGDMVVYQEDMVTPIPVGQETDEGVDLGTGSWLHRMMRELRYAAIFNGCDVNGLENCIDEGIWDHELLDPSTVRAASLCTPVGTWGRTHDTDTQQRLIYVGSLLRQNVALANRGYHPMLRKFGLPQETLNRWSDRVDRELMAETFRMCLRWRFAWGRRWEIATYNIPAVVASEALPSATKDGAHETKATTIPAGTSRGFKFMEICDTKEEAAAIMTMRRERVRNLPVPKVVSIRTPLA